MFVTSVGGGKSIMGVSLNRSLRFVHTDSFRNNTWLLRAALRRVTVVFAVAFWNTLVGAKIDKVTVNI